MANARLALATRCTLADQLLLLLVRILNVYPGPNAHACYCGDCLRDAVVPLKMLQDCDDGMVAAHIGARRTVLPNPQRMPAVFSTTAHASAGCGIRANAVCAGDRGALMPAPSPRLLGHGVRYHSAVGAGCGSGCARHGGFVCSGRCGRASGSFAIFYARVDDAGHDAEAHDTTHMLSTAAVAAGDVF
jgi:hypothetical protein